MYLISEMCQVVKYSVKAEAACADWLKDLPCRASLELRRSVTTIQLCVLCSNLLDWMRQWGLPCHPGLWESCQPPGWWWLLSIVMSSPWAASRSVQGGLHQPLYRAHSGIGRQAELFSITSSSVSFEAEKDCPWLRLWHRTLSAISFLSSVGQPSDFAKASASVSLPKRKSTYGSALLRVSLNGGTCAEQEYSMRSEGLHAKIAKTGLREFFWTTGLTILWGFAQIRSSLLHLHSRWLQTITNPTFEILSINIEGRGFRKAPQKWREQRDSCSKSSCSLQRVWQPAECSRVMQWWRNQQNRLLLPSLHISSFQAVAHGWPAALASVKSYQLMAQNKLHTSGNNFTICITPCLHAEDMILSRQKTQRTRNKSLDKKCKDIWNVGSE